MKQFTDNSGRAWKIKIDVGAIQKVRDLLQVNLLDVVKFGEDSLLDRLANDYMLVAEIVYIIAESNGVAKQDFLASMSGDTLDAAADALVEELVNFFPRQKRELLQAILQRAAKMKDAAMAEFRTAMNVSDKSIAQPESSVSTPEN